MNWNDNVNTQDGHKVKLADFIKLASGSIGISNFLKDAGLHVVDFEFNDPDNTENVSFITDLSTSMQDYYFLILLISEPEKEGDTCGSVCLYSVHGDEMTQVFQDATYNCDSITWKTNAAGKIEFEYEFSDDAPTHIKAKLIYFHAHF